ncbi:MAG: adenylosuccinate lyase [Saprospiraceae bacterium]|nr:adenylosuccinate lyase [Saprospiraceae bacterium]MCB9323407.1 adenylosuccinate lyase [Lewinellaceae bacterium]
MLTAISPIDGRYYSKVEALSNYFSEFALIRYRVFVEIEYFIALCEIPLPQLADVPLEKLEQLRGFVDEFEFEYAERVKEIERTTNHDVKAVEYLVKEFFDQVGLEKYREFVHFGLTSQDINNTAFPLMLKGALENVCFTAFDDLHELLYNLATKWLHVPMLARTHGQPASPTTVGKELQVFVERLNVQFAQLENISQKAKFGGATGNFNAHYVTYPDIQWIDFADDFVRDKLGLERSHPTTQIEHYDNLAAIFHALIRINTILIDLCRDVWTYISMDYFKQETIAGEIGSSAMPHKVNPIDFENAEGNLGLANALFGHMAEKLPVSRLQRDLTDSTVLRNIGVPIGHTLIALKSILKGLQKLSLNYGKVERDLDKNWAVVAEAIQNILRREGFDKPYEALKDLTRGKESISREDITAFIENLSVSEAVKEELKQINPRNYIGKGV